MSAAFQVAAPFGADIGGVMSALVAVHADAAFDSWLTIGPTDATAGNALASIGIGFAGWTATAGLSTDNGALFWMDPAAGPSGVVVMGQVTGSGSTATAWLQGRSTGGGEDYGRAVTWTW